MPRQLTTLLFATLLAAPLAADAIDDYVESVREREKIPGVAVLVARDGQIDHAKGYGFANLEHAVPVTPDTVFQSGSVGKMFTAAGILHLVEEGKLTLDDRLAQHFPGGPPSWQRITVRQLLTHTSGIKDYGDEFDYRKDYTDDEYLAVLEKLPLDFEPGSQWSYSNSGYVILGLLTTRLAGTHWSDYQAERIFRPLGMAATRVISESDLVPNRAAGYERDEAGEIKNQRWVAPTFNRFADGALYFSLRDLASWERALAAGRVVSPEHAEAWWTPVELAGGARHPYGFGWELGEQRGQPRLEHGGSWQGFRAALARYPVQRLMVAMLANLDAADTETMAHTVAGLVEPELRLREPDPAQRDANPERSANLRGVLAAWSTFQTDPAMAQGLAEAASGSLRETGDRRRTGQHLAAATGFRCLGVDELSPAARALTADGAERGVDCVLDTATERFAYRFLLDAEGRVVRFSSEAR